MNTRNIAPLSARDLGIMCTALLCILIPVTNAWGQAGQRILLFSDASLTHTYANDSGPGVLTVYVAHESLNDAAQGSIFAIRSAPGFSGVWLSESSPYSAFGTSPAGISIGYPTCLSGTAIVLQVNYTIFGTSENCSSLQVVNHPNYPDGIIEIPTCSFDLLLAIGGTLVINPTEGCAVSTERTTWGKVKSLYR